jgi:hypothetical protein
MTFADERRWTRIVGWTLRCAAILALAIVLILSLVKTKETWYVVLDLGNH